MASSDRIIFHIDMNSYFATVEQQANPHLRGLPVGVCEHLGGIIIAPSIEAKRIGIRTGTAVWEAQKIYPGIVLLPVDPPKYRHVTAGFLRIFSAYTERLERYSIDEAFLDCTGIATWRDALFLALEIKQRMRTELGEWLTCSVGIGPNKLIAKIAADMDKPDGITVVRPGDVAYLYDKLQLTDIPGIGRRLARHLNALGIYSLRSLAEYPESKLISHFGLPGYWLHRIGLLADVGDLTTPQQETIKSMGHAYTMPHATRDIREIRRLIFKLSEKVGRRLRQSLLSGSVVSCSARYQETAVMASGDSKSRNVHDWMSDGRAIFGEAFAIFRSFWRGLPVRMVAVTVSALTSAGVSVPMFERYQRQQRALAAVDRINGRYGTDTVYPAELLQAANLAGDSLGFGRIKEMPF